MSHPKFRKGFTWRAFLGILYAALVLGAVSVYTQLYFGLVILNALLYITLITISELSRYTASPMTKQELFIVYSVVSSLVPGIIYYFAMILNNAYLRASPLAFKFREPATGLPIPYAIPDWLAPPPGAEILVKRSFLNSEWAIPLTLAIGVAVLVTLAEISIGLLAAQLFVEVERLPFPTAPIAVRTIVNLAEREPMRTRAFAVSALLSIGYYFFLFLVPSVAVRVTGVAAMYVAPFFDVTYWLERVLPGAAFGITSNLIPYVTGFLIPKHIIISMIIGSFATYIIGNHITLITPFEAFSEWQREWAPTMSMYLVVARSTLWIWSPFILGASMGAAALILISSYRFFVEAFKSLLMGVRGESRAGFSPRLLLAMYFGSSTCLFLLTKMLVPEFPLPLLLIISVFLPFLVNLTSSRIIAETGGSLVIPTVHIRTLLIIASGYNRIAGWLVPLYTGGGGIWGATFASASDFVYKYRVAYDVETDPRDFVKAYVTSIFLILASSLLFMELFWKMAPIPSYIFRSTMYTFPTSVIQRSFLMTQVFRIYKPTLILSGAALIIVLGVALKLLNVRAISIFGLLMGFTIDPATAFAFFVGWLIGRLMGRVVKGWEMYRSDVAAGSIAGAGLAMALFAILNMMASAVWSKPY